MKKIEMIASGYEWDCPSCVAGNTEIEINEITVCHNCGEKFEIGEVHHAHGGSLSLRIEHPEWMSEC